MMEIMDKQIKWGATDTINLWKKSAQNKRNLNMLWHNVALLDTFITHPFHFNIFLKF